MTEFQKAMIGWIFIYRDSFFIRFLSSHQPKFGSSVSPMPGLEPQSIVNGLNSFRRRSRSAQFKFLAGRAGSMRKPLIRYTHWWIGLGKSLARTSGNRLLFSDIVWVH